MRKPTFDPGLTQQFTAPLRRAINKDGSFNVHRRGASWRDFHPYLHLINMGWPGFLLALFVGYLVINTLFAVAYY
jgi:inward rectifier potassium channel